MTATHRDRSQATRKERGTSRVYIRKMLRKTLPERADTPNSIP